MTTEAIVAMFGAALAAVFGALMAGKASHLKDVVAAKDAMLAEKEKERLRLEAHYDSQLNSIRVERDRLLESMSGLMKVVHHHGKKGDPVDEAERFTAVMTEEIKMDPHTLRRLLKKLKDE